MIKVITSIKKTYQEFNSPDIVNATGKYSPFELVVAEMQELNFEMHQYMQSNPKCIQKHIKEKINKLNKN